MSILFTSIGTILGSIYFILGDNRILFAAVICFLISSIAFTNLNHRRKEILSLLIAFLLVFFNYNYRAEQTEFQKLDQSILNATEFIVINKPKDKFFKSEFIVEARSKKINFIENFIKPSRFLAKVDSKEAITKGDRVEISDIKDLKLNKLDGFKARQYKKQKTYYQIDNHIVFKSHPDSFINNLRSKIKLYFFNSLSNENALITTSLLLGSRSSEIPQKFIKKVRNLGLGHFFAASGFHLMVLTLIIGFFFNLTKIKPEIGNSLTLIPVWIYAALAGFSPSIVRAAALISCYLLVKNFKRKTDTSRLLTILAGLILLIDPYTIFDLGFQYSYLACFAIITWAKPVKEKISKVKSIPSYLVEVIAITISVQLFLLPLVIYYFNKLHIWTIVANLLLSPLLSLLTLVSFLGLSFIIEPLLNLCKYLISLMVKLPWIELYTEINFESFFFITIALNLIAYSVFISKAEYKAKKSQKFDQMIGNFIKNFIANPYTRYATITSSIAILLANNIPPIGINKLKISNGIPYSNPEISKFMKSSKNHQYFQIGKLKALAIKKRNSLKDLDGLKLEPVHLLVLPNLNSNDIYLDTLINAIRPQFSTCSLKNNSPKVKHNLELLSHNTNTIVNSGSIYIGHDKFWSIAYE